MSDTRFRTVVEHAPDGVVILRDRKIVYMNAEAWRMLGLASEAEGLGRDMLSLMPAEEGARAGERIGQMIRTGVPMPPTEYYHPIDGKDRWVEIKSIVIEYDGAPAVLAFARDVTERHRLYAELVRADRLAAVGTLAAAVAHEINNPLAYASLSLEHVVRVLGDSPLVEHIDNARDGIARVATIVRDLRAFARVDDTPPGPVDVTAVVEHALKIADNQLRHRARVVRHYQSVGAVDGIGSRLEQLFLNLLINAAQALRDGGDPSHDEVTVEIAAGADGEVTIAIADTGVGIPPELQARVFDPFFTTKTVGEGTGLGLSVCRSIVEAHGGRISLTSSEGHGTRVEVVLREHRRTVPAPAPEPAPTPTAGQRLRILVIDDEPLVRRVLEMVLEDAHDLTVADSGESALGVLDAAFDVVLCDVMMPGMSGVEVYEAIRTRHPGLERRIVFVTGGAFVPRVAEFLDSVDNPKLWKPFDVRQVLDAVRAAVER